MIPSPPRSVIFVGFDDKLVRLCRRMKELHDANLCKEAPLLFCTIKAGIRETIPHNSVCIEITPRAGTRLFIIDEYSQHKSCEVMIHPSFDPMNNQEQLDLVARTFLDTFSRKQWIRRGHKRKLTEAERDQRKNERMAAQRAFRQAENRCNLSASLWQPAPVYEELPEQPHTD